MMTFHASTVHSKLVPKERNLDHRFSRSLGTEKRIPISLKRERESAQPEFALAMRFLEVSASASGGSHPTSVTTPTPKPKTQAASLVATEIIGDRSSLGGIAELVMGAGAVALDIETYGERKGDGLDPWSGDIRLLALCVENQQPWIIDLRAIGYDLGELKTALETVEIIAHNAKFDSALVAREVRAACQQGVLHCGGTPAHRRHQAWQRPR